MIENDIQMNLLLNEIEIDIENCDYKHVTDYQKIVDGLKAIFPEKYIRDIESALDNLKEDAEKENTYEAIKSETLRNTGNKDLAEDMAWELVYV